MRWNLPLKRTYASEAQSGEPDSAYALTFTLTDDYPAEVLEKPMSDRIIGRSGKRMFYCIVPPQRKEDFVISPSIKKHLVDLAIGGSLGWKIGADDAKLMRQAQLIAQEYSNLGEENIVAKCAANDVFGYGPISLLLEDKKNIEEIVLNGPSDNISLYHIKYGFCTTNLKFNSESVARYAINKMLMDSDKELNDGNPIIDASITLGARLHAQKGPFSASGLMASIRISQNKELSMAKLLRNGTISAEQLAYIWLAIDSKLNIIISGAPASGKTTLLAALREVMPRYDRIIIIEEEASETKFKSNFSNAVYLVGNKSGKFAGLSEQVVNSLRLRPDRIIVGEIRGQEAKDIFFGSNVGVPFMATMHSSGNGAAIISRLESKPMSVEQALVSNLDITIFMALSQDLKRVVQSIDDYFWLQRAELKPELGKSMQISSAFAIAGAGKDALRRSKAVLKYAMLNGISATEALTEFKKRSEFISSFVISSNPDLSDYITHYWDIK